MDTGLHSVTALESVSVNGSVVWVVWVSKALSVFSRGLGGLEDTQPTFSSVPKHICLSDKLHLLKRNRFIC